MTPQELEQTFHIERDSGHDAIIAATANFYITDLEATKKALPTVFTMVASVIAPHATYYCTEKMKRPRKFEKKALTYLDTALGSAHDPEESYVLEIHSGNHPELVGPWSFDCTILDAGALYYQAGFVRFSVPVVQAMGDHSQFRDLVHTVAEIMPFRHGYAGFSIVEQEGYPRSRRRKQLRGWYRRYRGLDGGSSHITIYLKDHVKTASWLTMLDPNFCAQLGGLEAMRNTLGACIDITERPSGAILQAGPEPILGDINQQEDMSLYKRVSDLIRPLRVPGGKFALNGLSKDETVEWLERFD